MTQQTEKEIEQAIIGSTITLTLTVGEVNMALSLLGKYPFEEVNGLVAKIHQQGQPQISETVQKIKDKAEQEASKPEVVA